jgi:hypothetical protein
MKVFTTKGLLEREQLTVKDVIEEGPNARVTATEWYLGDELVRRDAHVNFYAPQNVGTEQGSM